MKNNHVSTYVPKFRFLFMTGSKMVMNSFFRWAEMQENTSVAMVSYPENIGSGGQTGNNAPPDQAVLEADKRAVYK